MGPVLFPRSALIACFQYCVPLAQLYGASSYINSQLNGSQLAFWVPFATLAKARSQRRALAVEATKREQ